jgi:hypothetical protein
MPTAIRDTINALTSCCTDDDLRALNRACAWNVPDLDDLQAALKFGQPSVLGKVLSQSKLSAAERPALASQALLSLCSDPLSCPRPDRMAEVLLGAGADANAKTPQGICVLGQFAQQLGRIEAEEDHNALQPHHATTSGAGAKLRRLWDVVVAAGSPPAAAHDLRMSSYHDKTNMLTALQKRRAANAQSIQVARAKLG